MDNKITLSCPCHFGLESVLNFEIKKIGGENITVTDGRISFEGGYDILARANICLATAERVQIKLAEFHADTFDALFEGVKAIPLERFIGKSDAFPVKGHSLNSKLSSVPACQSIIKKAAVDRLASVYHLNYFEETGSVHQIQFNILKDTVTVYLDTSGAGLHKRGYRRNSNAAPIKETLAAGIVDLAMVKRNTIFCDPFCGSGTIPIEAAMMAANIAPGMNRSFTGEKWDNIIGRSMWYDCIDEANDLVDTSIETDIQGYDIDKEVLKTARRNAENAGVSGLIHFQERLAV